MPTCRVPGPLRNRDSNPQQNVSSIDTTRKHIGAVEPIDSEVLLRKEGDWMTPSPKALLDSKSVGLWYRENIGFALRPWGQKMRRQISNWLRLDSETHGIEETLLKSILNSADTLEIVGDALVKIRQSQQVVELNKSILKMIRDNPDLLNGTTGLQLGGSRGEFNPFRVNLGNHPRIAFNPEIIPTLQVASHEVTWLVRSITVEWSVEFNSDGTVTIHHEFTDLFDLRVNESDAPRPSYDAVVKPLGWIYHDLMGNTDKLRQHAQWHDTFDFGGHFYTVKNGDMLSSIALREYGDASLWKAIRNANKNAIGPKSDVIRPGQKLFIPKLPKSKSTAKQETSTSKDAVGKKYLDREDPNKFNIQFDEEPRK